MTFPIVIFAKLSQASAPLSPCLHFGFAVMASQLIAAHTALYGFYIHSYILNCSLNLLHHIGLHQIALIVTAQWSFCQAQPKLQLY